MIALRLITTFFLAQQPDPLTVAHQAEQAGKFAEAETAYKSWLATHEDAEVEQRLGLVLHLQNRFAEAVRPLQKAVELNPNLWGAQLFLGISLYRTNRFTEGLPHLEQAAHVQPGNSEIRFWIGATQLALKRTVAGLETLEQVRKEQPANTEVLRILAENYAALGSATLSHVAEQNSDSAPGLEVQGRALEFEGNARAAAEFYRRAIVMETGRAGAHAALARVLGTLGDSEGSLRAYREELNRDPTNAEANYTLGLSLLQKRPDEALSYLSKAAEWSDYWFAPWVALAKARRDLHDGQGSRAAAQRALEIEPGSNEAKALAAAQP